MLVFPLAKLYAACARLKSGLQTGLFESPGALADQPIGHAEIENGADKHKFERDRRQARQTHLRGFLGHASRLHFLTRRI